MGWGVIAQAAGRLDRGPGPPAGDHLGRHVGEQVRRQSDGADRCELGQLGEQGIEAHVAGVGLDRGQRARAVDISLVLQADQRLQPGDGPGVEACRHPGHQRLLRLAQRRSHDLGDAIRARRLDQLATAPGEEVVADPVLPTLGLGDVAGEPRGQLLGVDDAALPKPRVAADLGAVALAGTAGHVVGAEFARRHSHLAGDVGHGIVGQLVAAPGEPASPEQELQRQGEAEPRPPGFVAAVKDAVSWRATESLQFT